MEKQNPIFLAPFLVSSLLNSIQVLAQNGEHESEFNYLGWNPKGPEHWGELRNEWSACSNGNLQSPISLIDSEAQSGDFWGDLRRTYGSGNASLVNRGETIMLKWADDGAGDFDVDQTKHMLKQLHWHSPSEHTINGRRYDLELHMVHQSIDGKIAVVSLLYEIGGPDTFLAKLGDHIGSIAQKSGAERGVGVVDPRDVGLEGGEYYRYTGSLTSPPCTEGVSWTIIKQVKTLAWRQVVMLRNAVNHDSAFNSRPLQPTNNRPVYHCIAPATFS